ncbi:MAG: MFS transporter, partial [Pseudomonadota bacterium]
ISFLVMAVSMGLTASLVLLVKEPPRPKGATIKNDDPLMVRSRKLFVEPFVQIWGRYGRVMIPILGLVFVYRLSDFTMGVMASPLYADIGYTPAIVGAVQSGPGVAATFVGLFIGGLASQQIGLTRSLIVGSILTLVTNGAYAWFASTAGSDDVGLLTMAVCADNLAGGFVTTVFIAYLSSLVDPANAATQYALFSSLYAFVNKFLAGYSGVLADTLGYVNFFLLTASYAIPAALLVMVVGWMMRRYPPQPVGFSEGTKT